jgi:superoxide dismutase, Fe-Mn family
MTDLYTLPELPYSFDALAPWCPAETLKLHHGKHHATYVKEANALATKLADVDPKDELTLGALQTALSFNLSGHLLHSLFWTSITPASGGRPSGELASRIKTAFGSFERFTAMFTSACVKVQGSGWGALMIDPATGALRVGSILNHTNGLAPGAQLVAVVDVWEHAYYLTHKNDRPTWVGAAIDHLDWEAIARRCDEAVAPASLAAGA